MPEEEFYVEIAFGKGNPITRKPWTMRETFGTYEEAREAWLKVNHVLDKMVEKVSNRLTIEHRRPFGRNKHIRPEVPLVFPEEEHLDESAEKAATEKV